MNKTQTTMLTIGLLVVVAFCAFVGGMHVGGKETSVASECVLPAPVQADSDAAKATPAQADGEGDAIAISTIPSFVTDSYFVTITHLHKEGCVECNNMIYHGVSRDTGAEITLKGSTLNSHSPDGMPTRSRGYEFHNGNTTYTVLEEGWLIVAQGDETLLREDGVWGAVVSRPN